MTMNVYATAFIRMINRLLVICTSWNSFFSWASMYEPSTFITRFSHLQKTA
jgi:hypothetical protein